MPQISSNLKKYSEDTIKVLKGLEPVKQRPGMYTLTDSPLHIVQEVIDNSSDEVLAGFCDRIELTLHQDGSVSVEDNGRGIPIGEHPEEKVPVIELVFTRLHAGGKFNKANGGAYAFSGGLHGVGVSVTNALSTRLEVTVWRDGLESTIAFKDGFVCESLSSVKSPRPKRQTGTRVRCWPDPKYFSSSNIPKDNLIHLLRSKAVLLPGCTVVYREEATGLEQIWLYKGGLKEYLVDQIENEFIATPFEAEGFATEDDENFSEGEGASWVLAWTEEGPLKQESFVNLIPTSSGGTHVAGLKDGIFQAVKTYMESHGLGTKGVKLTSEDVFARANFILNAKVLDPQFQGQVKDRLISREALRLISTFVRTQMEFWLNIHGEDSKKLIDAFIKQAQARQHSAQKVERKKGSSVAVLPGKLTDCTSGDIARNELFLVEGDSAGGSAKKGRDKDYQAILPLRGKILNSWEENPDQVLRSQEIHDISVAIGVDPHKTGEIADLSGLRYGKICIMADADVDGSHIEVLLLTLFYRHFSYLIEKGHIFVAMPPLFKVTVGKIGKKKERRIYCLNDEELSSTIEKLKKEKLKEEQIEISRFKGLGEMDWQELRETSLDPETRRLLPVKVGEPGIPLTDKAMNILMSREKANDRKMWIERHGDMFEPDI